MLFNSLQFFVFLAISVVAYFALPSRSRWMYLLAASYYFYMCWKPEYVVLIFASTIVDYAVGLGLGRWRRIGMRRLLLAASLTTNLGLLFSFKYLDFFTESTKRALAAFNVFVDVPEFHLLLPVGISFYTFQTLSYTIDVYRGVTPVERHFGIFALYVSFFPQLVAGPIERSNHLLPQLRADHAFDPDRVTAGLRMILWGLFKKMVVADLVAPVVNTVYAAPEGYSGPVLILATVLFSVQIYCDFSGYSDIAIGVARLLGIDLMTNFRQPYFSTSIREFWRRWHISLSTWFRDYVYKPLGGSRGSRSRHLANILFVFVVSGLWHGAGWTFVIWGFLHGLFLVTSILTVPIRDRILERSGLNRLPRLLTTMRVVFIFSLVLIAWVFFRAASLSDALYILTHAHRLQGFGPEDLFGLGLPRFEMTLAFLVTGVVFFVDWVLWSQSELLRTAWRRRSLRWACYVAALGAIACFGVFQEMEFIYFQF